MNQTKTPNESLYIAVVCLVAVISVIPIAVYGIPDSSDWSQHFRFAQTFYDSLINGHGYTGWADRENFGYGDVGIRFYPPLEYYFLAFARILAGNWYDAAWLTFMFWMASGSVGIYLWAKCWLSPKESAIAACLYAIIPLHLLQLYINFNNYSEVAAASILVFCFAFLTRIFQRGKTSDVLGLAVSYAFLVLTHLPLTVIGSLSLCVFALTLARKNDLFRPIVKSSIALASGLAASAFYWVGMVSEMKWLNHSSDKFTSGHFSFDNGFFPFFYYTDSTALKTLFLLIDLAVVFSLLFVASAIIYVIYKRLSNNDDGEANQTKTVFRTVLPLGLFAFFMVTPLSNPIWQSFTPLQKVQFPARWLPIVAMCGAIIASASIHYLLKGNFLKQRIWAYSCLIILTVVSLFNLIYILSPTAFIPLDREKFDSKLRELPETESFDCWWTVWSKREAFNIKEKISAGGRQAKVVVWKPEERVFEVAGGNDSTAKIATFYYPHWQATVNDKPVNIEKDENGVMLIPLGSEKSVIKLYFQEPPTVRTASIISLLEWLLFGGFFLVLLGKKLLSPKRLFE